MGDGWVEGPLQRDSLPTFEIAVEWAKLRVIFSSFNGHATVYIDGCWVASKYLTIRWRDDKKDVEVIEGDLCRVSMDTWKRNKEWSIQQDQQKKLDPWAFS